MRVAEAQPRVFISYARADDEPFVQELHRDLEAAGIDVWWDRDQMASRGRTFLQEIRDAIESVDRIIGVIGPAAIHSDYVRYEWEHAALFAKGLLPILRLGDYSLVPSELLPEDDQGLAASDLGRLHCPDFRAERSYEKALDELVAIIRQPVPRLASYDGTPALPPHFLPRRDELNWLKEMVLADVLRPTVITSAKQTAALQGMGGVGKSVLAAAFARAVSTRRALADGIIWLSAGQDATKLTLLANIRAVGMAFGDADEHYLDDVSARKRLPDVLADKVCLIILDDVWSMEQVEPFRNGLGPRCRLLVTTRDGSLVTALGAEEHRVDVLSVEQALALLAEWSGQVEETLAGGARQVAGECGNLPLALALCGAMARDGTPWPDLLEALRETDLTFIEARLPNYAFSNVLRALRVSVDMLGREDAAAVRRYHDLAVFPREAVSEAAVLTLWCREKGFSERSARKLLTTLGRKALLTVQGHSPHRRLSFHDLQHDYLRAVAGDGIATLHSTLIDAYRPKCPRGWASGPDDGYFFQFLPHHLAAAGRHDDLKVLLADYAWIEAKLKATDVQSVMSDYDLIANEPDLSLVQRALRLSIPALSRDRTYLPSQLIGRLRSFEEPRVRALLEKANAGPGTPWLCPQTLSLVAPGPLLRTLVGHRSHVTDVTLLPDGRRALSGSYDGTLRLWDLETGESRALTDRAGTIYAMGVLPDGRRALSGSYDGTLRLWDLETGESRLFAGHTGTVRALAVLADGRRALSGSADATLRLWDLQTGESRTLTGHTGSVNAVAMLPDGRRALSGSYDHTLRLWDLETGESREFAGHWNTVMAVVVLPDGRRALSGSVDASLRLWDLETGESRTLRGHTNGVTAVALLPDSRRALSGSHDHTLRLWDLETGESRTLRGHTNGVAAVAVLPDGRRALSGSADSTLRLWDLETGESPMIAGHTGGVKAVAALPDGRRALSGSFDNTLRLWDLKTGKSRALTGHTGGVMTVAVLPDGRRALSGSFDNTLRLWDLETGESRAFPGYSWNSAVAVLPDGRRVLSGYDNSLRLWDLKTGESRDLAGHTGGVTAVAVLPDGRRALSGSHDMTLRLWDLETGESRGFAGHRHQVNKVAVLPDGRRALSGSADRTLRLWDLETGESRALTGHTYGVTQVAVLPDGRRALSGSGDHTLRLWDLETGESRTLTGHTGSVHAVAMLPDGRRALSGADDWTLILWDLESAGPIATFIGDAEIRALAIAREDLFVAGSANGAIHILKLAGLGHAQARIQWRPPSGG